MTTTSANAGNTANNNNNDKEDYFEPAKIGKGILPHIKYSLGEEVYKIAVKTYDKIDEMESQKELCDKEIDACTKVLWGMFNRIMFGETREPKEISE